MNNISRHVIGWTCLAAVLVMLSEGRAANSQLLTPEHHPWGRFTPGAWQLTRTTSETLDQHGHVVRTTVTQTKTTLLSLDERHYTLKVESTVEVLGKRFEATPQIVKRTYDDLPYDQAMETRVAEQADLTIDNHRYPCTVLETVAETAVQHVVARTYYSRQARPFTLRRDVTISQHGEAAPKSQTSSYVVALDMPQKVLGKTYTASHIKSVHKQQGGTVVTLSVQVLDLPGGIVSQTTKEQDENGHVIRRSTLELVDFGFDSPVEAVAPSEPPNRMGLMFFPLVPCRLHRRHLETGRHLQSGHRMVATQHWGR